MATLAQIAVQSVGEGPLRIEEVNIPDPQPSQVLVKQYASGVCHSQIHQMEMARSRPILLGHESTGVIMKVGSDVKYVKEGDTVLLSWVPRDVAGAERPFSLVNLDVSDGTAGAWEPVFTWGTHSLIDEQFVVKVSSDIKPDVASIIGCAVMTGIGAVNNTADVQTGETVAIFGVGGVGLSTITGARLRGAKKIICVDLDDEKLEFAIKFGATDVVNASREDPVKAILKMTSRKERMDLFGRFVAGVDCAFDCIGIPQTVKQVLQVCRRGEYGVGEGGKAVLVGLPGEKVELDAFDLLVHQKKLLGSLAGGCVPGRDFEGFVDMHRKGELDLESMVTARYTLDQVNEAVDDLKNGKIFGRAIIEF